MRDAETGLTYMRARHYDPGSGRFMQRDTFAGGIASPASLNRYSYALNNPVGNVDPSGRAPVNPQPPPRVDGPTPQPPCTTGQLSDKCGKGFDVPGPDRTPRQDGPPEDQYTGRCVRLSTCGGSGFIPRAAGPGGPGQVDVQPAPDPPGPPAPFSGSHIQDGVLVLENVPFIFTAMSPGPLVIAYPGEPDLRTTTGIATYHHERFHALYQAPLLAPLAVVGGPLAPYAAWMAGMGLSYVVLGQGNWQEGHRLNPLEQQASEYARKQVGGVCTHRGYGSGC